MRDVRIVSGVNPYAEGSVEVRFGNTKLLITASVEEEVPRWMEQGSGGWITAEYGMLPRATHTRSRREAASGKQGGRTLEIQRLIGRALRAAVDLKEIEGLTIRLDCDVLTADGGTRTAAISGGWVALHQAIEWCKKKKMVAVDTELRGIAAVSLGIVDGEPRLDLCYEEDSAAEFDLNVVMNGDLSLIEVQGTAENGDISREDLNTLITLAEKGVREVFEIQSSVAGLGGSN